MSDNLIRWLAVWVVCVGVNLFCVLLLARRQYEDIGWGLPQIFWFALRVATYVSLIGYNSEGRSFSSYALGSFFLAFIGEVTWAAHTSNKENRK